MSLLFKHLRIHQVFGANTEVGKTILTSALIRASSFRDNTVFYLKPISTGPVDNADEEHVKRHAGPARVVHTKCLYRFREPVSPHLAARLASGSGDSNIPSDTMFVNAIASHIRRCAGLSMGPAHMFVETAGGVHSPTLSGTTQVDAYRPLFLPTILVGDSKLGGISSTISSYEALLLRGFIVDSVILFREDYYRNWEYLKPYFAERGVHFSVVDPPPEPAANALENFSVTEKYYEKILSPETEDGIFDILHHLDTCHIDRLEDLDTMPRRTHDTVWWPFVQHGLIQDEKDVTLIDSAWSDFFSVGNRSGATADEGMSRDISILQPQFDGSASWWTQALGHAHPALTLAAARASGRYGHVMFPEASHLPALKLAEHLVHHGPGKGWASRAFFSDNGSTGMEVALKMALRTFSVREGKDLDDVEKKHLGVLGLRGSYHGDTIGAMDACEEGVFSCEWHRAKGYWFEPPTISIRKGDVLVTLPSAITTSMQSSKVVLGFESLSGVYDVPTRLHSPLAQIYRDYIQSSLQNLTKASGLKLATLVIEPLVMGAGGMIFVDPLFQRVMIDVVRPAALSSSRSGLPVIFDEVFVGLYRLGMQSTASVLGVYPDISVNAKVLTGGIVPLAVTLASNSVFRAFLSDNKADALLHGHSYTAHPVGCEVANEAMKLVGKLASSDLWRTAKDKWTDSVKGSVDIWSFWDPDFIHAVSHMNIVAEVMTLGTVFSVKFKDKQGGYVSQSARKILRPLERITGDEISAAPGGAPFGIHFRTLGNVAYFITSLNTSPSVIQSVEDKIQKAIRQACS